MTSLMTLIREFLADLRCWYREDDLGRELHRRETFAVLYHLKREDYVAAMDLLTFSKRLDDVVLIEQFTQDALAHGVSSETLTALAERYRIYADILEHDDRHTEIGPRITAVQVTLTGLSGYAGEEVRDRSSALPF